MWSGKTAVREALFAENEKSGEVVSRNVVGSDSYILPTTRVILILFISMFDTIVTAIFPL